jgi:hypothetical protein
VSAEEEEVEEEVEGLDPLEGVDSLEPPLSFAAVGSDLDVDSDVLDFPLPLDEAEAADRESVMYQPLPLNTIPTG